jgi:hypothetical protein
VCTRPHYATHVGPEIEALIISGPEISRKKAQVTETSWGWEGATHRKRWKKWIFRGTIGCLMDLQSLCCGEPRELSKRYTSRHRHLMDCSHLGHTPAAHYGTQSCHPQLTSEELQHSVCQVMLTLSCLYIPFMPGPQLCGSATRTK